MPKLNFFRQARVDGGIRTGIDIDGTTGIDRLERGTGEDDPALTWFVDLRCDGESVPTKLEEARQWLLDHKALVREAYVAFGKKLEVGMDPDVVPLQCEFPNAPPGVRMTTVCSSTGTIPARQMSETVKDIAEHWEQYLNQLPQVQAPLG